MSELRFNSQTFSARGNINVVVPFRFPTGAERIIKQKTAKEKISFLIIRDFTVMLACLLGLLCGAAGGRRLGRS